MTIILAVEDYFLGSPSLPVLMPLAFMHDERNIDPIHHSELNGKLPVPHE